MDYYKVCHVVVRHRCMCVSPILCGKAFDAIAPGTINPLKLQTLFMDYNVLCTRFRITYYYCTSAAVITYILCGCWFRAVLVVAAPHLSLTRYVILKFRSAPVS